MHQWKSIGSHTVIHIVGHLSFVIFEWRSVYFAVVIINSLLSIVSFHVLSNRIKSNESILFCIWTNNFKCSRHELKPISTNVLKQANINERVSRIKRAKQKNSTSGIEWKQIERIYVVIHSALGTGKCVFVCNAKTQLWMIASKSHALIWFVFFFWIEQELLLLCIRCINLYGQRCCRVLLLFIVNARVYRTYDIYWRMPPWA